MRRLVTPKWLLCHVGMVALVVAFLRLGWWQLSRAEGGNGLSIGYTLEWPAFAAFVIVVWLREIRTVLAAERAAASEPSERPEQPTVPVNDVLASARAARAARTRQADHDRAGSAEYNDYLAFLAANPDARRSDYRAPHIEEVTAHD
jgi:hypothetical protein